jgi:hypothetical protein
MVNQILIKSWCGALMCRAHSGIATAAKWFAFGSFCHFAVISVKKKGPTLVVVNLNSDDYSDREIDIFSANQIPAF